MTIRIHRNTEPGAPRLKAARLPVGQTLVWVGPLFILIQEHRP